MSPLSSSSPLWVMRKPRSLGNFSIETSYKSMRDAWPSHAPLPQVHVVGHFTSGIADRWHIWREVHSAQAPLVHITGDIHFAAIGFRNAPVILTIHDLGMLDQGRFLERWIKKMLLANVAFEVMRPTDRGFRRNQTGHSPSDRLSIGPHPCDSQRDLPVVSRENIEPRPTPSPEHCTSGLPTIKTSKVMPRLWLDSMFICGSLGSRPHLKWPCWITFAWITAAPSKLTEAQLQAEYAASDVLLFCSTLEGYGMPIIEAQTVGVPVITSQRPPLDDTRWRRRAFG